VRVALICVGRLSREYAAVHHHYEALLRPYLTLEVIEVADVPLSQGEGRVLAREGEGLRRRLRPGAFTVALDRGGKEIGSTDLSAFLAQEKLYGHGDFQFILGGALGLDQSLLDAADFVWSLSRLTFPHQLARCLVVEQLYRAVRIERGEPYHH
jgi:23S rRNA (pseudouridine1915-N3)-methyltransferase